MHVQQWSILLLSGDNTYEAVACGSLGIAWSTHSPSDPVGPSTHMRQPMGIIEWEARQQASTPFIKTCLRPLSLLACQLPPLYAHWYPMLYSSDACDRCIQYLVVSALAPPLAKMLRILLACLVTSADQIIDVS